MLFPRTKLIDTLIARIEEEDPSSIIIHGPKGSGKTTFLKLLENAWILNPKHTEYVRTDIHEHETRLHKPEYIVIDADISVDFQDIRTFIKSKLPETKIIYTCEHYEGKEEKDMFVFEIPYISFREFAEWHHHPINIGDIMQGEAEMSRLLELRETYMHLGQFGEHLTKWENTQRVWNEKMEQMKTHLFPKEHDQFLEFARTLAMSVGELFKEEKIAKLIGISRRKVRKYAEILAKHHVVRAVGPYYRDTDVELSRHVKLYFSDLSYMDTLLSVGYYHGTTKQGVIENFILLELDRKLKETHVIYFYRKKSGAEMQFVLEEKETEKLTPIEVYLRWSSAISQAMKTFDEAYSENVDHYMILNESVAEQKEIWENSIIVLPHVAI